MLRICRKLAGILLLLPAALSFAQDYPKAPIEPLLYNDDPRMVVFGAWAAGRWDDDSAITWLLQMVEQWDADYRQREQAEEAADHYDAMREILDTLIQRKVVVPSSGVVVIAPTFPDQALILIDRLSSAESEPILLSWYQGGRDRETLRTDPDRKAKLLLARVAATMLAKDRSRSFAPILLADTAEHLVVSATSHGGSAVARCAVDCQAPPPCQPEYADEARKGWPPLFQYAVEENREPSQDDSLLIETGEERITYRRVKAEMHLTDCYVPVPLNDASRHQLLSAMLRTPDRQMPWSAQMDLTYPWINDHMFLLDLSRQVDMAETQLRATVKAFYANGLLTPSEMATTRPKLDVVVHDDRPRSDPPNSPLPQLPITDTRTTCRVLSPRY